MTSLKYLQWLTIMLTALVMGVFWGTWFTLTRSIENFPPDSFILIGKTIIRNVALPMSILMPLTLLCMMVLCWMIRSANYTFRLGSTAGKMEILSCRENIYIHWQFSHAHHWKSEIPELKFSALLRFWFWNKLSQLDWLFWELYSPTINSGHLKFFVWLTENYNLSSLLKDT